MTAKFVVIHSFVGRARILSYQRAEHHKCLTLLTITSHIGTKPFAL